MERLPSYQEIKENWPLKDAQKAFIEQSRQTIRHILEGQDSRLLLIVGPCSIHDLTSAREFALKLKNLTKIVSQQFFLVMRVYFEKPRTRKGWKGLLYDPLLNNTHQIHTGINWTRQFLLELAELQIPAATEFLDPLTASYYDDLIAWGSIGARTSSSQPHRQLASSLTMPIGIKNGINGHIPETINSLISVSHPHAYVGLNAQNQLVMKQTSGNQDAHLVLRGGKRGPNYDVRCIAKALKELQKFKLPLRLIVDCSHQNSRKNHELQILAFQSVIQQILEGNSTIRGLMLESHLNAGKQEFPASSGHLKYGISITDACLDWQTTENLILQTSELLMQYFSFKNEKLEPFSHLYAVAN